MVKKHHCRDSSDDNSRLSRARCELGIKLEVCEGHKSMDKLWRKVIVKTESHLVVIFACWKSNAFIEVDESPALCHPTV